MSLDTDSSNSDPLRTRHSMLARVRAGESQAWEWFAARYQGFVVEALARSMWPRARAEEAAAQFWGYLFESRVIDRVDPAQRFRGFLVGTLRNYARSWCRQERDRHLVQAEDEAPPDQPTYDDLPEDAEASLWTKHVLTLCFADLLRENARQALALRWFYGIPDTGEAGVMPLGGPEIASKLGLDVNAVHQLLFRARKRLRSLVEEELRQHVTRDEDFDDELRTLVESAGRAMPGLLEIAPA